ncbi:nucleotidyltransferase-like protein [Kribbella amoyensis]|uniref:Nucleotidyltransferase-like protein n=1 Tax=Kribbella amoyensis TaxID=996641 RepID=A0A561C0T9_9ACTN|nr:nucleotidyltransferase domain-containing protein [Kribbella amoyensis]TWD84688.1 nucleotidyltransferase-like protein [Kribbella amoyensis]
MRHHEDTLAAFVSTVRPEWLAVVLDGSVARGTERPDSDVDVTVVVPDEVFAQARAEDRVSYVEREVATYEGGYVDVKVVTLALLAAGTERGDEPMRAAFTNARIAWTRDDVIRADLEPLLKAVVELGEEEWDRRMAAAIAVVRLQAGYFAKQAFASGEEYLLRHAVLHAVSAAGRALLAYNRVLFQGHKYLFPTLAGLDELPDGFVDQARTVLADPTPERLEDLVQSVEAFHEWPLTQEATLSRYVSDNELAWLDRTLPTEYR